jgi:hypothetical protein
VRVFKTKWFERFARRERIADEALREAVARAERGLIDADLGGGVIKQRVARPGEGRRGGYRSIVLFQVGARAVFAYGFAKSARDTLRPDELEAFRLLAGEFERYDEAAIDRAMAAGELSEVMDDG